MKKIISYALSLIMVFTVFGYSATVYAGEHRTMGTAKEYSVGETVNGTLDENRIEFIRFNLSQSGRLSFKAEGTSSYQVYIFQENVPEQYIYVDYVRNNSDLGKAYNNTFYNLLAGTYYFKLNNDSRNANNYSITTAFTPSNETFAENFDLNNDIIGKANDIEFGKSYKGMLGINDKNDYYKIVSTNGKYTLKVNSDNKAIDAILLNSDGDRIENYYTSKNYATGAYTLNETILLKSGVYYLKMYDYDGSTFYSFSLTPYSTADNSSVPVKKPTTVKISKLQSKKKAMVVYWNKQNGAIGYEVQIATDKKFKKNRKNYSVKNVNKKTVKKLKSKKKYFVRVRAYKSANGKKIYGNWSAVKSVKVK